MPGARVDARNAAQRHRRGRGGRDLQERASCRHRAPQFPPAWPSAQRNARHYDQAHPVIVDEGAEAGFQQVDLQLQKGDRLYFFSDGIPDQFGGTRGKKLKVAGLQSFLKEHGEMSMEEQGKVLREFLIQWMEGHEQVDDMLVIGFEV